MVSTKMAAELTKPSEEGKPLQEGAEAETASLSEDEIIARLRLNSSKLVKEIYEIALRRVQYESGRQQRLDAKATSLLTATGLSLTVAFTFGATLLSAGGQAAFHEFYNYVLLLFYSAISLGIVSAGFALGALLVRSGYATVRDTAVFNVALLQKANQLANAEGDDDAEDNALMVYQRGLIPHIWKIGTAHERQHETKALVIKIGQSVFGLFLLAVLCLCISVGIALSSAAKSHGQATTGVAREAAGTAGPARSAPRQ